MVLARATRLLLILGCFALAWCGRPEREKAIRMVHEAAVFLEQEGLVKGLAELNRPDGRFVDGEYYVFAYDLRCVMAAHPMNPKLVGKSMLGVPDVDGKLFREDVMRLAQGPGWGWVRYKYRNPVSGQISSKVTWVRRVGNLILCCGVYE